MGLGGAAVAGSALAGAATSFLGSRAAGAGARNAQNIAQEQYQQNRALLAPYNTAGQAALPTLVNLATGGPTGGGPDYVAQAARLGSGPDQMAALAKTPGYQFALDQGLAAVQNNAAAHGLGMSPAAMQGAAQYATGLASQTYQQQFQNLLGLNTAQQGNLTNLYTRAAGLAGIGANAAATTGNQGVSLANTAANAAIGQGQANAAGIAGVGSALSQGVQNYLGYNIAQQAMQNQAAFQHDLLQNQQAMLGQGTTAGFPSNPVQTYVAGSLPTNSIMGAYAPGYTGY